MEQRNYKLYVHIAPNGKRYYGITCQEPKNRWLNGKGYSKNKHFTNAINKYGWDNFTHGVLFNNLTKEEACLLEKCYIALYDTTNNKYGYNKSYGGDSGLMVTPETREKLSKSKLGDLNPAKQPEVRTKIGQAKKGKPLTEETKKKMSESRRGENNPFYGQHHAEETKNKISESVKAQFTEEHKKKISEAQKGKHHTEEHKKKISEGMRGKNSNPVLMFTKEGEFIRRFDSIADANEYLGKDRYNSNISLCATGTNKTAYGYIWKYEKDCK